MPFVTDSNSGLKTDIPGLEPGFALCYHYTKHPLGAFVTPLRRAADPARIVDVMDNALMMSGRPFEKATVNAPKTMMERLMTIIIAEKIGQKCSWVPRAVLRRRSTSVGNDSSWRGTQPSLTTAYGWVELTRRPEDSASAPDIVVRKSDVAKSRCDQRKWLSLLFISTQCRLSQRPSHIRRV